jgi:hypothetical protein
VSRGRIVEKAIATLTCPGVPSLPEQRTTARSNRLETVMMAWQHPTSTQRCSLRGGATLVLMGTVDHRESEKYPGRWRQ